MLVSRVRQGKICEELGSIIMLQDIDIRKNHENNLAI